jgi:carnitine O-acetyltransferase
VIFLPTSYQLLITCSLNFNIVSKRLGAHRMSYFLNEAASELRDLLMPDLAAQAEKAKL